MQQEEYDTIDTNAELLFLIALCLGVLVSVEGRWFTSGSFCSSPPALQARVVVEGVIISVACLMILDGKIHLGFKSWILHKLLSEQCYLTELSSWLAS